MRYLLCPILIVLIVSAFSFAAVPQTINYQGNLSSSSGSPVNAAVDMTFTIYNAATNGTNLWTEDQTVQVNNGIYAVALGALNPIDPAIVDGDLWLGVKLGEDAEMTPRQKLHSVPFSMKAQALASGAMLDSICHDVYAEDVFKTPSFCPPVAHKKVFVTSSSYQGNFGGIAAADQICQNHAIDAGLPGTFKAWISTSAESPSTSFAPFSLPYFLVDGYWAFTNEDWGTNWLLSGPHHGINLDENGQTVESDVWTGTTQLGLLSGQNCNDWTVTAGVGGVGSSQKDYSEWTSDSPTSPTADCSTFLPLYCFEQ